MQTFDWKNQYSVGIEKVDTQHKQLLELSRLLFVAMKQAHAEDIIDQAVEGLVLYTLTHFKDEEDMLRERNSALLEEHIREHEILAEEAAGLKRENMMGFLDDIADQLADWVETRLIPHMVQSDGKAFAATHRVAHHAA